MVIGYEYAEDCDDIVVKIDPDLMEIIPGFLATRERDIEIITIALENNDFPTIKRIGHNLKGEGGSYGFNAITTIGTQMEEAAKEEDSEKISDLLNQLSRYMARVEIVF
jgi:HPt (histidine-containing phosphotransfer) domain-containing protein